MSLDKAVPPTPTMSAVKARIHVTEWFKDTKWLMFFYTPLKYFKSASSPSAVALKAKAARRRDYLATNALKFLLCKLKARAAEGHEHANIVIRSSARYGIILLFEGFEETFDLCAETKIPYSSALDGMLKEDLVARLKEMGYAVCLSEPWTEPRWWNDTAQHFFISWANPN
eukprot:jgi/Botrbrau1/14791/Bobra.105_1s0006.1